MGSKLRTAGQEQGLGAGCSPGPYGDRQWWLSITIAARAVARAGPGQGCNGRTFAGRKGRRSQRTRGTRRGLFSQAESQRSRSGHSPRYVFVRWATTKSIGWALSHPKLVNKGPIKLGDAAFLRKNFGTNSVLIVPYLFRLLDIFCSVLFWYNLSLQFSFRVSICSAVIKSLRVQINLGSVLLRAVSLQ